MDKNNDNKLKPLNQNKKKKKITETIITWKS